MSLAEAVSLLERGEWQAAHRIAQEDESELGSWVHGVVHLMEGDLSNAHYWYRRAGRELVDRSSLETEIRDLRRHLEASASD